jgi:aspartyl-tRNA(Asn)/glutamyl-tRNA(Gln) amidotransferase subunit A
MTRTVEDSAIMLQAIAGHDARDATSSRTAVPEYLLALADGVGGLRIGVPRHYVAPDDTRVSPEVLTMFEEALKILQAAGASIEKVSVPALDAVSRAQQRIMLREAFLVHERSLRSRPQDFGELARGRLQEGSRVTPEQYATAQGVRDELTRQLADLLRRIDIIALPTTPTAAPRVENAEAMRAAGGPNYTRAFNVTGMPAISVPCGFTRDRLPVGIQFAGRPFEESTVLRTAHTLELRVRRAELRPPI